MDGLYMPSVYRCNLGFRCVKGCWCALGCRCALGFRCVLGFRCAIGFRCALGFRNVLEAICSGKMFGLGVFWGHSFRPNGWLRCALGELWSFYLESPSLWKNWFSTASCAATFLALLGQGCFRPLYLQHISGYFQFLFKLLIVCSLFWFIGVASLVFIIPLLNILLFTQGYKNS
jgi:hypothetical protein